MAIAVFDSFTMGFALAVHIVLAVIGVALPVIILTSEFIGIRNKDKYYLTLSRRLTTAFIVLFAVGSSSGTLVAFSLFFLWPNFIGIVNNVAILPVYLEVFAFFGESIFLGIYLYSGRVFGNTYSHVALMGFIGFFAAASASLITVLNSFMNTPVGFNIATYLKNGTLTNVNPVAVFSAPAVGIEVTHVLATSYFAGAALFLVYFSYQLLKANEIKTKTYYRKAVKLTFVLVLIGVVASLITGVISIEQLLIIQPEKYAAIELNIVAQSHAPETIGGIYLQNSTEYALVVPDLQSFMLRNQSLIVPGLDQYPRSTWPPLIVHDMFDLMVFLGMIIGLVFFVAAILYLLKRITVDNRLFLKLFILSGIGAVVLLENGWMVDEFGRQPWIIYNVMTVQQAANQSSIALPVSIAIVILYAFLIPLTMVILNRIFSKRPLLKEL